MVSWRNAANWLSVSCAVSWPLIVTRTLRRTVQPADDVEQCGLSTAARPHQADELPGITWSSAATSALTTSSPSLCSFHTLLTSMTGFLTGSVSSGAAAAGVVECGHVRANLPRSGIGWVDVMRR